jgi:hypothetical protein
MRSARLAVLVATTASLLLHASPAHAEILWRGGFEPGDLSEWNEFTGPVDERVTIVDDPVRDGLLAARVEIRPGDLGNGDLNRVEMGYHPPEAWGEGTERYYAWSLMMPDDVVLGDAWHLLTYFEAEVLYTNAMSLRLYGDGTLSFCTFVGGEEVHWSTPFEQGMWHDFVLHVVWSPDAATGVVELWYDDELVLPATNVATMHTGGDGVARPNFLHQGVLRYEGITETEVLFFDGTMEATALEDVMPDRGATTSGDDGADTTVGDDDGTTVDTSGEAGDLDTNAADDDATATAPADDDTATDASATASATNGGEDTTTDTTAVDEGEGGCSCDANLPTRWPGLLLVWLLTRLRRRRPR